MSAMIEGAGAIAGPLVAGLDLCRLRTA
jgi:hypothetical protein